MKTIMRGKSLNFLLSVAEYKVKVSGFFCGLNTMYVEE